jgi:hypothetical protein
VEAARLVAKSQEKNARLLTYSQNRIAPNAGDAKTKKQGRVVRPCSVILPNATETQLSH